MMRRIILASNSSRKKALLEQVIGNNFECLAAEYEEDNSLEMSPEKLVMHHSRQKARSIKHKFESGIIIGADTLCVNQNQVIGKPLTEQKAKQTLKNISGKQIEVISGITLIDLDSNKEITDYEKTKVRIKELTEREIEEYVATGEPLDKAGAFGIQGKGVFLVERIEGCYFNVVGFPLYKLVEMMKQLETSVFDFE